MGDYRDHYLKKDVLLLADCYYYQLMFLKSLLIHV